LSWPAHAGHLGDEEFCGATKSRFEIALEPFDLIVIKALQEFLARRRRKRLLDLIGKLEWDTSFDYKSERRRD